ncbi:MAG TPA: hypothetical protein VE981_19330 [Planctomycetota bacterium]|nr:hypothetical protein [Planctomycetota bacterium]
MSDDAAAPRPAPRVPVAFLIALTALTLLFLIFAIRRSNRTTLRGDEIMTLFHNRDGKSLLEVALKGERGQISRAPLYYLVDRSMDASRHALRYLGLTPPGYYRLPSILFTAGFGLAAALLTAFRVRRQESQRGIPELLILCALATYWFNPKVYSFACTERPYSLWNGLWLLALTLLLCRPQSRLPILVTLCLLASAASISCFQILAIGIAMLILNRIEGRPVKPTLRDLLRTLAAPLLVGAYYALRSDPYAFEERDYGEAAQGFVKFWLVTNLPAWIAAAAACGLTLSRPKLREYALPACTLAVLLFLMPVIFTLAYSKGYSSPSRQYLWTATALPLVLMTAALGWQEIRRWRPAPAIALVLGIGLAAGHMVANFARPQRRNDSRELVFLDRGSPLEVLLRSERPRNLYLATDTQEIEMKNFHLIAEWIRVRYAERPLGSTDFFIRDVQGRLVSDPPGSLPESKTGFIGVSLSP